MVQNDLPEIAPLWLTVVSFMADNLDADIEIQLGNGSILEYEIVGTFKSLRLHFEAKHLPQILRTWKSVDAGFISGYLTIRTKLAVDSDGLRGFHSIVEAAIYHNIRFGCSFEESLVASLKEYRSLVAAEELNQNVIVGLLGELLAFEEIRKALGYEFALHSWHSKHDAIHDFDMGTWDLEVKTTTRADRVHKISSIHQLENSPERPLYLMSIQICEADQDSAERFNLSDLLGNISIGLERLDRKLKEDFQARVNLVLSEADLNFDEVFEIEMQHYRLRSKTRLIHVSSDFPRVTPGALKTPIEVARIVGIEYEINCMELGSDAYSMKVNNDA
jgi:hypothetical protein